MFADLPIHAGAPLCLRSDLRARRRLVTRLSLPLALVVSVGCAGHREADFSVDMKDAFEGRCALSAKPVQESRTDAPSRDDVSSASVPSTLSRESRAMAEILDVRDVVAAIASLEGRGAERDPALLVPLLAARQYLSSRIQSALTEVASAAAEVRCEKERADHLADRLQASLNREVRALTLSAIVVGAVFGFASGGLFLAGVTTAGTAVSLSGGVVEGVLGAIGLAEDRSGTFGHRRNVLRELWQGRGENPVLPEVVWRFLNQPLHEDAQRRSLRETLTVRWREDGRVGTPGSERARRRVVLLFGDGGRYDIGDLRARAAMLNSLEADIQLMTQNLNLFIEEQLARSRPSLPRF